jgi:hypothetical protein
VPATALHGCVLLLGVVVAADDADILALGALAGREGKAVHLPARGVLPSQGQAQASSLRHAMRFHQATTVAALTTQLALLLDSDILALTAFSFLTSYWIMLISEMKSSTRSAGTWMRVAISRAHVAMYLQTHKRLSV